MPNRLRSRQWPALRWPRGRIVLVARVFMAAVISGCASSNPAAPSTFDKALDLFGLQSKPAVTPPTAESLAEAAARLPKRITLRIHAGEVLNTDAAGRSLALVTQWYRLKDAGAFLQAPYDAFKDGGKTPAIEGVIDQREIVLTPGQKYEVVESLPIGTAYVGLVALFRAPDEKRWRFVFETQSAAKSGLTIGAHGCALSVSEGTPIDAPPETLRLAGVRCR